MARPGVGFEDISEAADALLDAGERPTTEKIRGLLGRGSPNTIGPLLDRWWAALGQRLREQQAKLDIPEAPPEVATLATQLWAQALSAAQQVAEAGLASNRAGLEEARRAFETERNTQQADVEAAAAAAEAAVRAMGLAETRLHDVQRLNEQQALQLVDLAQQRDALQARYDRQEAEMLGLTERLRHQEAVAATEQAAHNLHLRATEDRAHTEIDRARQEAKDLRAQLTALARERATSEHLLRQQREEAVATTVTAQREAGLQRGRAEALEQQLARLGDLPATLQATLAQAQNISKRSINRDKTGTKRATKRKSALD